MLSVVIQFNSSAGLFTKKLVYLAILISNKDYIVVPPLQGFVMNRVQGDYMETLLYKVFVTISEHTSVGDLACMLQIDELEVKVLTAVFLVTCINVTMISLFATYMYLVHT